MSFWDSFGKSAVLETTNDFTRYGVAENGGETDNSKSITPSMETETVSVIASDNPTPANDVTKGDDAIVVTSDELLDGTAIEHCQEEHPASPEAIPDSVMGAPQEVIPVSQPLSSLKHGARTAKITTESASGKYIAAKKSGLSIKTAKDIASKETEFLVPDLIPVGTVTLVAGMPGSNKTSFVLDIAAKLSVGGSLNSDLQCRLGDSLLFCGEDPHHIVKERLQAGGADLTRIHVVTDDGEGDAFKLSTSLDEFENALYQCPSIKYVVFDTAQIFMGDCTPDVATQCARSLQRIAEQHQIAIICVTHMNKTTGFGAVNSIRDFGALTRVSRHVWMITKDPHDADRRIVTIVKTNLMREPQAFAYMVGGKHLIWEDERYDITSDDMIRELKEAQRAQKLSDKYDPRDEFLYDLLRNGPVSHADIERAAEEKGFVMSQLLRILKKLGGKSLKGKGQGKNSGWYWCFPWCDEHADEIEAALETENKKGA